MKSKKKKQKPLVAVLMGSQSDWEHMKGACEALDVFAIPYHVEILSAHRTPEECAKFGKLARKKGFLVLIAGAGGAAHLPGLMASHSDLPVVGVPVPIGPLQGQDALLSIVQMPKGVPVATVGIGNSFNAGLLATQILSVGGSLSKQRGRKLALDVGKYKSDLRKKVRQSSKKLG